MGNNKIQLSSEACGYSVGVQPNEIKYRHSITAETTQHQKCYHYHGELSGDHQRKNELTLRKQHRIARLLGTRVVSPCYMHCFINVLKNFTT